jgi:hypothetical protein
MYPTELRISSLGPTVAMHATEVHLQGTTFSRLFIFHYGRPWSLRIYLQRDLTNDVFSLIVCHRYAILWREVETYYLTTEKNY